MKQPVILRLLTILLGLVALSMVPPFIFALLDKDPQVIGGFLFPIVFALVATVVVLFLGSPANIQFSKGDGFVVVSLAWIFTSLYGALPFYLSGVTPNPVDALFESVSGFTTTGASIFQSVEALPRAILLWRAITHWLGGMGIVVLTVALLPLLGVGGFQLIKAETPGPEKDKVTPRVTATAKILWLIYIFLTVLEIILLRMAGMTWFDAVCHAFATMATGGFGTKNASVGHYNSAFIDWIITCFMFLAGMNFSLYYRLIQGKIEDIWHNTELRVYVAIVLIATLVVSLAIQDSYESFIHALRYGAFQVVSIITTTGFATADFDGWASLAKGVLFLLMFVGGCSGSTGGGIKVIRHVVLFKQAGNELRRAIYPHGVFSVCLNGKVGRKDVVYGVAGFVFLYLSLVFGVTLITTVAGVDLLSAFSTALVTTGNIGPGFGLVGPTQNYGFLPDYVKIACSFAMIAGRLELLTLFVLFSPVFWRR